MPGGTYVVGEVRERFRCLPESGGWRYTAERDDGGTIELTADGAWRPARLQVTAGEHALRGGAAGRELLWVTAGREHAAVASGFLADSPGLLVALARSLTLAEGERADVRVVRLTRPTLAARTVPERWTLAEIVQYEEQGATLPVERYEIADLETGEVTELHLAGDVVVAATGVELADLDGPPGFL